jgi:bisanhydrobacterioruberin hydratase
MSPANRTFFATTLAIAMHLTGALGNLLGMEELFAKLTPFNLLVMFGLLLWTLPEKSSKVAVFIVIASLTGFFCEMIGVKTGALFGSYHYSNMLGWKINDVPMLISINWFIVIYGSGMLASQIRHWIAIHIPFPGKAIYSKWFGLSLVIDGALIATVFDWIMEPAAVNLGFWSWEGGQIPMLNYISWFLISLFLLAVFALMKMKPHAFASNLLLIQAAFFLVLR